MIHVCSLARLHDTVRETGARHVVTLIKDVSLVHRPATIPAENHLLLDMDDITDHIEGYVAPAEDFGTCCASCAPGTAAPLWCIVMRARRSPAFIAACTPTRAATRPDRAPDPRRLRSQSEHAAERSPTIAQRRVG
jgi:hypothetical protein